MENAIYHEKFLIESDYVDCKKECRLSSLLRLFQEIAIHHLESIGFGDSLIRKKGLHWVVARYHAEIVRMPRYEETIRIETHAAPARGPLFPRYFDVYSNENERIIRAGSVWALVDESTRSMIIPSAYDIQDFGELTGEEIAFPLSLRLEDKGEKKIIDASYSLCDMNGHLNNCAYLDVLENLIPISFLKSNSPSSLDIQYKKEIMLGESIPVTFDFDSGSYCFYSDYFTSKIAFKKTN